MKSLPPLACLPLYIASHIACASAPVSYVDHVIATPQPHAVAYTIPGMATIQQIKEAGKFTWAVDYTHSKFAIFDGSHWTPAMPIADFSNTAYFLPAYPITGTHAQAWAMGNMQLAYFDGKSWSAHFDPKKLLAIPSKPQDSFWSYDFRTSGGYVFLAATDDNEVRFTIYSLNTQRWSAPQSLPAYKSFFMSNSFVGYNAENPHALLIASTRDGKNNFVITINHDASSHILALPTEYYEPDLLAQHGRDYRYQSYTAPATINYNSASNPDAWNTLNIPTLIPGTTGFNDNFESKSLSKNHICVYASTYGPTSTDAVSFSCINLDTPQPQWQPTVSLTKEAKSWDMITTETGAWGIVNWNNPQTAAKIYRYDFNTQKLFDTHFVQQIHVPDNNQLITHALTQSSLVVCSSQRDNPITPIQLYAYDTSANQPHWQSLKLPNNEVTDCGFSYLIGGNYKQTTSDFWIYNQPHENPQTHGMTAMHQHVTTR